MSYSNGVISAPVNTDDVGAVLGRASHDVKTLCMNADKKINKWAKFKPEVINQPNSITLEQRKNNNFGLMPAAVYADFSSFRNAVKNNTFKGGWGYTSVGENDWGRLDDFVGYNHNSTSPLGDLLPVTLYLSSNTNQHTYVPASPPLLDETSISLADMQKTDYDFKNWYLGVLLYKSDTRYLVATATQTMTNATDWQVDLGYVGPSYADTYKAVPFLSNKIITSSASIPSGLRIVGTDNNPVSIVLATLTSLYRFVLSCVFPDPSINKISYSLQIINNNTASQSWSNIKIYIASDSNGTNSVEIANIGSVTVPANGQVLKQGSANVSYNGLASNHYLFCRVAFTGATSADQQWIPIDQADLPEDM